MSKGLILRPIPFWFCFFLAGQGLLGWSLFMPDTRNGVSMYAYHTHRAPKAITRPYLHSVYELKDQGLFHTLVCSAYLIAVPDMAFRKQLAITHCWQQRWGCGDRAGTSQLERRTVCIKLLSFYAALEIFHTLFISFKDKDNICVYKEWHFDTYWYALQDRFKINYNVHMHTCQMFQYYQMQNSSLLNIIPECFVSQCLFSSSFHPNLTSN